MCGPSSTVSVPTGRVLSPLSFFVPIFVPESPPPAGSVLYRGTANTKTDPCFGNTIGTRRREEWIKMGCGLAGQNQARRSHAPFDLFFRVTTLNVFSVSCTTMPDAPTSAAFLLLRTMSLSSINQPIDTPPCTPVAPEPIHKHQNSPSLASASDPRRESTKKAE
jgi:hypothetical protein